MIRKAMFLLIAILALGGLGVGLSPMTGTAQDLTAGSRGNGPERAASYINPDTGLATENRNVEKDSECRTPDQKDRQKVSPAGSVENNVHNDACLFKNGNGPFDGPVSFEIDGVGVISACPDPDGAGPKTAAVKNQGKRCYLTGYQETGMAGDEEYHTRTNSDGRTGEAVITFCHDPNDNGCRDAKVKDKISIIWKS